MNTIGVRLLGALESLSNSYKWEHCVRLAMFLVFNFIILQLVLKSVLSCRILSEFVLDIRDEAIRGKDRRRFSSVWDGARHLLALLELKGWFEDWGLGIHVVSSLLEFVLLTNVRYRDTIKAFALNNTSWISRFFYTYPTTNC